MIPQPNIVDNVPTVGWLSLPKGFAHVFKDMIDGSIGIIYQDIQLTILLCFDCLKELFNLVLFAMIN